MNTDVMATWADLPSELRRFIITMGKEIITEEFLTHQESFQGCLFDISHETFDQIRVGVKDLILVKSMNDKMKDLIPEKVDMANIKKIAHRASFLDTFDFDINDKITGDMVYNIYSQFSLMKYCMLMEEDVRNIFLEKPLGFFCENGFSNGVDMIKNDLEMSESEIKESYGDEDYEDGGDKECYDKYIGENLKEVMFKHENIFSILGDVNPKWYL